MIRNAFFPSFQELLRYAFGSLETSYGMKIMFVVVAGAVSGDAPAVFGPGSRRGRAQDASGLN